MENAMKRQMTSEKIILVATGDPELSETACELLSSDGFNVALAYSWSSACALLAETTPDAIVLDADLAEVEQINRYMCSGCGCSSCRSPIILASEMNLMLIKKLNAFERFESVIQKKNVRRRLSAEVEALFGVGKNNCLRCLAGAEANGKEQKRLHSFEMLN